MDRLHRLRLPPPLPFYPLETRMRAHARAHRHTDTYVYMYTQALDVRVNGHCLSVGGDSWLKKRSTGPTALSCIGVRGLNRINFIQEI